MHQQSRRRVFSHTLTMSSRNLPSKLAILVRSIPDHRIIAKHDHGRDRDVDLLVSLHIFPVH